MDFYFTDRKFNLIGIASAGGDSPIQIVDDIDDQMAPNSVGRNYTGTLVTDIADASKLADMAKFGNFVLYRDSRGNYVFATVVDWPEPGYNPQSGELTFVAENGGIDLINETVSAYKATKAMTIAEYLTIFTNDSGFEVGVNEISKLTRTLEWDSDDETALARIESVATQFDNAELDFRFDVSGTAVVKRYIDIYKHIGADKGQRLEVNTHLNSITTTGNIYDLCTSIRGTGGTPDGSETAITLKGYKWSDPAGRYVLGDDGVLRDTQAVQLWSRALSNRNPNPKIHHIQRDRTYSAVTQATLLQSVLSDLKTFNHAAINYIVDIADLPDDVVIGDTVHLVDEAQGLNLSARLLELKDSYADDTHEATLGDYLIEANQVDPNIQALADQLKDAATKKDVAASLKPYATQTWTNTQVKSASDTLGAKIATNTAGVTAAKKQADNALTAANGKNKTWYGTSLPSNPSNGDILFLTKADGSVAEEVYQDGKWVIVTDDTTGKQIADKVDASLTKLNNDLGEANTKLATAQQDVAALETKLADNADTQAKLAQDITANAAAQASLDSRLTANTDAQATLSTNLATAQKSIAALQTILADNDTAQTELQKAVAANTAAQATLSSNLDANAALLASNKKSVDAALTTVNTTLAQATKDTATAVANAAAAVKQANSAADGSTLATQTAQAAGEAALAAKSLASQTATDFAAVKSQASAAADNASAALTQAGSALTQAQSAISTASTAQDGVTKVSAKYDSLNGTLSAQIKTMQTAVDGIQVGGTNLLRDTAFAVQTNKFWSKAPSCGISTTEKPTNSQNNSYFFTTQMANANNGLANTLSKSMPDGEKFSVGVWLKASEPTTVMVESSGVTSASFSVTTEWTYYTSHQLQFANGRQTLYIRLAATGTITAPITVYINSPKVESGNMCTAWSPAPEDAGSAIATNTLAINANSKQIALMATQQTVDTLKQQVTTNSAQLKLTATAADLKVTSQQVDTLSQTVTENSAALKLTATSAALETQKQVVDKLNGTVQTNTAAITAVNGAITLKADSTTVVTLAGTVKQQGIDLTAAQGQLALKLTQEDLTKGLNGYATQTWSQQQLAASATTFEAKLSEGLSRIGGKNYIYNSEFSDNATGWLITNNPLINVQTAYKSGINVYNGSNGVAIGATQATSTTWSTLRSTPVPTAPGQAWSASAVAFIPSAYASDTTVKITQKAYIEIDYLDTDEKTVVARKVSNMFDLNAQFSQQKLIRENFVCPDNGAFVCVVLVLLGPGYPVFVQPMLSRDSTVGIYHSDSVDTASYNDLLVTVNGLSNTAAKQTDLTTVTNKLNVTASGLSNVTAVIGAKGEQVTKLRSDLDAFETTMSGYGQLTTNVQTLQGFQKTATSDISGLKATQTLMSNQWTSAIGSANLIVNSEFINGLAGWTNRGNTKSSVTGFGGESVGINGIEIKATEAGWWGVTSTPVDAVPGQVFSASVKACYPGADYVPEASYGEIQFRDSKNTVLGSSILSLNTTKTNTWQTPVKEGVVAPANCTNIVMNLVIHGTGWIKFEHPMLVNGGMVGAYHPDSVSGSQITQLQNQIDLRATVAGKVTAALNLSSDGGGTVLIQGASLYVTAASHFDSAIIQSAAIASLDAAKITSGSISADRLATTKLNADNITSGSIAASLLSATAISATNIISGTLDATKLTVKGLSASSIVSGSISAALLATTKLNADNITSGSISAALLATTKLSATNITSGTLDAGLLTVKNISASSIVSGSISAALLASTAISATNITSGTLDVGKLTVKGLSASMIATGELDASKVTVSNLSASNIIGGTLDAGTVRIKDLSASTITGGTLNAAALNVIGLNANSITSGTLKAVALEGNTITGAKLIGDTMTLTGSLNMAYKYSESSGVDQRSFDGNWTIANNYIRSTGTEASSATTKDTTLNGYYETFVGGDVLKFRRYDKMGGTLKYRLDMHAGRFSIGKNWNADDGAYISANGLGHFANIVINGNHSILSRDGVGLGLYDAGGSTTVTLYAKDFIKQSRLSTKTNISALSGDEALNTLLNTDIRRYQYKDGNDPKVYVGPIIDDQNDVPLYSTPGEFTDLERKGVIDSTIVGYLVQTVKQLNKRIEKLEEKVA